MAETDDEELLVTHVLTEEEMLIEGLNTSFSEKKRKMLWIYKPKEI